MRHWLYFFFLICFSLGCGQNNSRQEVIASSETNNEASSIINKAIAVHGGENFNQVAITFNFRDKHYTATRKNGLYTYTHSFSDSTGQVRDVLKNNSFSRFINGQKIALPAERVKAFSSSVNSVIYFALLPLGLNDPAVEKELLGKVVINKIPYYKIKVGFRQEGGGEDFQDEFLYYINQKTFTMDYLAYTFATDGGGIRFRKAINPKRVGGILFQEYINYEPKAAIDFWEIEQAFETGRLTELSRIELRQIKVKAF
ncbi:DUF6503 family protein [Adhaeribacter aquaticus]|uniref:DUF6503 family protein n=1 Tax=Adhaeribacter aquaticus TaxID=299567 RepID=UPI00041082F1|nr:DUF6503 family protein [Adhaeribacter aquaticus]